MHVLGAWEDGELLVEPVERAVVIADTQQQARPRACALPRRGRLPGEQEICSCPSGLTAGPRRRLWQPPAVHPHLALDRAAIVQGTEAHAREEADAEWARARRWCCIVN